MKGRKMALSVGKKMGLSTLLFSLTAIVPFVILAIMAVSTAQQSFIDNKLESLTTVAAIKKSQIERFFNERVGDAKVLADNPFVHQAFKEMDAVFKQAGGATGNSFTGYGNEKYDSPSEYRTAHDKYFQTFKYYMGQYGYYDIFLMDLENGDTIFTVVKEPDFGQRASLIESSLRDVWKAAARQGEVAVSDMSPYAPSGGIPAQFVAAPIKEGSEIIGVVALQISHDAINGIMQERDGMGKTGETYLIGKDRLMRSDSFLDPDNHSVKTSFANPTKGSVDTEASREALAGKNGVKTINDYMGNSVLSAYTPVKVGNTSWALLAEIDEQEVVHDSVTAKRLVDHVWIIGMVAGALVLAVILFNVVMIRNLSKTLNQLSAHLGESSDQVACASVQVSSASQQLAEGASEQAASLEETSSSLEEMASMTRQNSNNAGQADSLMKEADRVVDMAASSMTDLTHSMMQISQASEETSKIIKTIDEIAFQTNLLALNAAVEAARAGEAGAGFAVVADEVRNLAMRAAEAAKNTAGLIEGTVKKVKDGSELVSRTNTAFSEVAKRVARVGELVGEISAASAEQAQGIDQLNKAAAEMDKVVQQNAANAEESASASEEMSAQAEQMRAFVESLVELVRGSGNGNGKRKSVPMGKKNPQVVASISPSRRPLHSAGQGTGKGNGSAPIISKRGAKEPKPEQVIPVADAGYINF